MNAQENGTTVLHTAALDNGGDANRVKFLLGIGADPSSRKTRWTLLYSACKLSTHAAVIIELLGAGAEAHMNVPCSDSWFGAAPDNAVLPLHALVFNDNMCMMVEKQRVIQEFIRSRPGTGPTKCDLITPCRGVHPGELEVSAE